jgi:hypothetical protein
MAYVAMESGKRSSNEQVKESQRRPEGTWEPAGNVDVDLLLTCRQIYNEAVLAPFSANDFGLDSYLSRSDGRTKILFLRDLVPDQSRTISTLHIYGTTRRGHAGFVQQHINTLSALRTLKLRFGWDMMDIQGSPGQLMAALEDRFDASGVSIFATANLQTIDVKIGVTVFHRDVQAITERKEELVDWMGSKRDLLLTRQSPVRRTRRAAAVTEQTLPISQRIQARKEQNEDDR